MPLYRLKEGVEPYLSVNCIHPLKQRQIAELIQKTKRQYPQVTHIAVFGSTVDGRCRVGSDIDICVWGGKGIGFTPPDNDEYDVVFAEDLPAASPLRAEILRDGWVVYARDADKDCTI